jgi:hypothetical protein
MPLWGKTDNASGLPKFKGGAATDTVLFEDMNTVYQDAFPGVVDPSNRVGWYFKNAVKGNKVNWYFFSNTMATVKLGTVAFYAVVTLDSTASKPFLAIYTVKEGAGDASSWYRSRIVSTMPSGDVGTKYLICVGNVPSYIFPDLPRMVLTPSTVSTVGPKGANETVLTISLGSDSGASANNVKFVCEAAGVISPEYTKNSIFRIKANYNVATDTGTSSGMVSEKSSNVYLVDDTEAPLAKSKGITGPGWWTYKTYTTSTGKIRHRAECLVAMSVPKSVAGDSSRDDAILPNS